MCWIASHVAGLQVHVNSEDETDFAGDVPLREVPGVTPQPPLRKGSINSITSPRSIGGARPTPTPPSSPPATVTSGGVKKVMSTAEEKALNMTLRIILWLHQLLLVGT